MSYRPVPQQNGLHGPEGRLVFVRLRVVPRSLEEALEALAQASFPVNPEIRHGHPWSWVEFPAYDGNVKEIHSLLDRSGLQDVRVEVEGALEAIR